MRPVAVIALLPSFVCLVISGYKDRPIAAAKAMMCAAERAGSV
jgi:hypothetical protein